MEREAPLSWYTPRIFSLVIYFQCKGTKIFSFDQINHHLFCFLIENFIIDNLAMLNTNNSFESQILAIFKFFKSFVSF